MIIGADHGGGKSRYLIRTNILSSKARRENNKTDFGTRTLQFCEVDCKKDVFQIQAKIAPYINNAKRVIEKSRLVAIKMVIATLSVFLSQKNRAIYVPVTQMYSLP